MLLGISGFWLEVLDGDDFHPIGFDARIEIEASKLAFMLWLVAEKNGLQRGAMHSPGSGSA